MRKYCQDSITRRTLLIGAAVAAPILTQGDAQAAGTFPQTSVNYQQSPNNGDRCGACKFFVAPSSCKSVAGTINPNGWCKLFNKKA